jgi:hypothetical protein
MPFKDRGLMVPNTFTGRPNVSSTDAAYRVKASDVNENFEAAAKPIAITQALGPECADNGSLPAECKLHLPLGRFGVGDRCVIVEDRPTARTWCVLAVAGFTGEDISFDDTDLHDVTLAGTADYDTIQADLLIYCIVQQDKEFIPAQALLKGKVFGLDGSDLPWKDGETDTIADKFDAGAAGTPGGGDKAVQFNDAGAFGGDETIFLFDKANSFFAAAQAPDLTNTPDGGAVVGGDDNALGATAVRSVALGGMHHDADAADCAIIGGTTDTIEPGGNHSVILGGEGNSIKVTFGAPFGSVIAGGAYNEVDYDAYSAIVGGTYNKAHAAKGVILGGTGNQIDQTVDNAVLMGQEAKAVAGRGGMLGHAQPDGGIAQANYPRYGRLPFGGDNTGVNYSFKLPLEDEHAYTYEITLNVVDNATGNVDALVIEGACKMTGGASADCAGGAGQQVRLVAQEIGTLGYQVSAITTNGYLEVNVNGVGGGQRYLVSGVVKWVEQAMTLP